MLMHLKPLVRQQPTLAGHQGPQLGQVQLIRRPPNAPGNLGLPYGNTGSWSGSNSNWEQPISASLVPTVNLVSQTNWPQGDNQWNIYNPRPNVLRLGELGSAHKISPTNICTTTKLCFSTNKYTPIADIPSTLHAGLEQDVSRDRIRGQSADSTRSASVVC